MVAYNISGVSQAIKETVDSRKRISKLIDTKKKKAFHIKIAETRLEKEMAFRLAYKTYLEKGFIQANDKEMLVDAYDTNEDTVIFIVQDETKQVVGSVSLVFDQANKSLPTDTIYAENLNELRNQKLKITEICRLVIDSQSRNSKEILLLLFNYLAIYSYHNKQYDSLIVQVNPRHSSYYMALLNFDLIGTEKLCPKVNNAPAVLLHLPLARYQERIQYFSTLEVLPKRERSLYPLFIRPEQEELVAEYLAEQESQMSESDKYYFDLIDDNMIVIEPDDYSYII